MQRMHVNNDRQVIDEPLEPSPLIRLARRIRQEQGPAQTRAFLSAMIPFAAPGELTNAAESFGISPESVFGERAKETRPESPPLNNQQNMGDIIRMIQMLSQLRAISSVGQNAGAPSMPGGIEQLLALLSKR